MATTTIYANKGSTVQINLDTGVAHGMGKASRMPIGKYDNKKYRALLGFSYSFTDILSIESAILNLRTTEMSTSAYIEPSSDPDIQIVRLIQSFPEGTASDLSASNAVTWDNQPSGTAVHQISTADVTTSEAEWQQIDITLMLQDALAEGVFYGLRILAVDESSENDTWEFSSNDTQAVPYIDLVYTPNTEPNEPILLTPTDDQIVHTIAPTFAGTMSDPDAGDSLSAIQIRVYEGDDEGGDLLWDSGTLAASGTVFSKTYAGPALTGNRFYAWQGRVRDKRGLWGDYSALQSFKINSIPGKPTQAIQGDYLDLITLTPTLFVTQNDPDPTDSDMTGYRVLVYRLTDNALMWDTGDVTVSPIRTLSLAYAGSSLSWQTSYYWKSRTKDGNGAWSPYANTSSFKTHRTAVPSSMFPSGGYVTGSLTPILMGFRGSTNDTLVTAEIEVYASNGTTLIWSSGTFSVGVTATGFSKTYSGTTLSGSTEYKWRARVTGNIGGTSSWSSLNSFTTKDTVSPTITTPLGSGITDLTPDITFTRGTNFNAYDLYVYDPEAGGSYIWNDTDTHSSTGSKTVTYSGPALEYAHTYLIDVRVSSDGGSNWSSLAGVVSFRTDESGIPTLTAPVDDSWETTSTPSFSGTTESSETIDTYRIKVYLSDGVTLFWDSGDLSGSGTSFTKVYDGSVQFTPGESYYWTASYVSGGIPGSEAPAERFHINAAPQAPSNTTPVSGEVVPDDLSPVFSGVFDDVDVSSWGDTPSQFDVEVYRVSDGTLMHSLQKTSSLVAGANTLERTSEGTVLAYETEYMYRMRYKDSKSAIGEWSPYVVFKPSQSPTVDITLPTDPINSPSFTVSWTYSSPSSKVQQRYQVQISRTSDQVVIYDTGEVTSADTSWIMPSGYLNNNTGYTVTVNVWDSDGLIDSDSVSVTSDWTPPVAVSGFSVTTDTSASAVTLKWDQSTLDTELFSHYSVYRRKSDEDMFTPYDEIVNQGEVEYVDTLAAANTVYDYKVTQFQAVPGDVDLESEDGDIASAYIDADYWFVIGADGSVEHSLELPVTGEAHQKPIQQEVFEPLGSNRKKTARGNVLGHEGSLDCTWTHDEREVAKTFLDYIAQTPGPHILKSPFGDVWQVEFAGPQYKYAPAGGLSVTLAWIEVV